MRAVITKRLLVRDFMSSKVVTTHPQTRVASAIKVMAEKNIGSLLVVDSSGPLGVLTERDVISKVLGHEREPADTLTMEVLSPHYVAIGPDDTLLQAARKMIAKKSRLVIFEGSDLAGIVTATDLVKGIYDSGEEFNIRSAITKKVVTDYPETPVALVIQDLNEKRIGSVMVVRDEMPYGIFTERDLIRRVLVPKRSLRTPVGDVVTTPLITAKADISGREAAKIMITNRIKRLPLFDKKAMVGIVTARDIVDAFVRRST